MSTSTTGTRMRVGSLFSGIGGIDLGLERAGMTVSWQSEVNPYASQVLAKHWPTVPNLGDVTTIDWSTVEPVDLICGGYPCQPFSLAGRRAGQADPRHLWPYFAEALRILRPGWALLENVRGHLSLGFKEVLEDLAALGFDAEWEVLPAAAFGAPHLRHRLLVVAHAQGNARRVSDGDRLSDAGAGHVAHADRQGRLQQGRIVGQEWGRSGDGGSQMADAHGELQGHGHNGEAAVFPPGTGRHEGGRNALQDTDHWLAEPDVGRVADGVPKRVDRLKCLGNAVVPQVAEWVGRQIMAVAHVG